IVRSAGRDRRDRNDARRSTHPAFEFVANHPRAAADTPLLNRAAMCGLDRVSNVFGFDVKPVHIIEPAVPCLGYDGQTPGESLSVWTAMRETPGNHGVACDANAVGISQNDWAFQKSTFFHPRSTSHLAIAIERKVSGKHR